MVSLNKIILFFVIFIFILTLQSNRIFSVYGVQPNFLLIVSMLVVFSPVFGGKINLKIFFGLILSVLAAAVFWFPFWIWPMVLTVFIIAASYFLENFLTGSGILDFLTAIFFGTALFYGVSFLSGSNFSLPLILWEGAYNMLFGIILWLVIHYGFLNLPVFYEKR